MNRNYLFFFVFLAIILTAGFHFFYQSALADTGSAITITVKISVCGNGVQEYGEDCDGSDLGGASCSSRGFLSGTLACSPACEYDTSGCSSSPSCGDSVCNGSETCSSCSTDCGACPGGGGGGGGGGGIPATPAPVITQVNFSGKAYPKSNITLLKDAQIAATTIAGADANFQLAAAGLSAGNYIFSIYAEDKEGRRSALLTFPVSVTLGATAQVSGVFISPTIAVDKSEVKLGDTISIFGQTVSTAEVLINVSSDPEFFFKIKATADGVYFHQMDTTPLIMGSHSAKSKAIDPNDAISPFSLAVAFTVGAKNVPMKEEKFLKGELNGDGRVNLVDFSIAAYWYKRPSPPANVDLNSDGKIDLTDFSIMAYYWTG